MVEPLPLGFRKGYQLKKFIKAAIKLPPDRLRTIHSGWDTMRSQQAVVSELVESSTGIRKEMLALRRYIAEMTRALDPGGDLIAEEVADAIFPAARALLLRETLQESNDPEQVAAFAVLTEPFEDMLPVP